MRTWEARERLLAAAHRVIGGKIENSPPGPNDDAEAEYAEEMLVEAAAELVRATIKERLEKAHPDAAPALAGRITEHAVAVADDASAASHTGGDYRL